MKRIKLSDSEPSEWSDNEILERISNKLIIYFNDDSTSEYYCDEYNLQDFKLLGPCTEKRIIKITCTNSYGHTYDIYKG